MRKFSLLKKFLTGFFLLFIAGLTINAQIITLRAADDAVVVEPQPTLTAEDLHGSNIFVNGDVDSTVIAYVKFDISNYAGRVVEEAQFSARGDMADGETMTIMVTTAGNGFSRDTTNWDNRPNSGNDELASGIHDQESDRKMYVSNASELTDYVNNALITGNDYISVAMKYKEGAVNQLKWMGGTGDGLAWGPNLTLEFAKEYSSYSIDDATVFEKNPDWTANELHGSNIFIGEATDSTVISYVKFDISGIKGQIVSNAEFSTRSDMADDSTMTIALKGTDPSFTRDTTDWENRPSLGDELATVVLDMESNRKVYLSTGNALVKYINKHLTLGKEVITFALHYKSGAGSSFKWMAGTGDATWAPQLELEFGPGVAEADMFPIADAVVFEKNPDLTGADVHGSNIYINGAVDSVVFSYVKFDIAAFQGKVVDDAIFSTRSDMADDSVMTVKLTKAGDGFIRDTTNWNNKPNSSGELATVVLDMESNRKEYTNVGSELVDYINSKLAAGADVISFALKYKEGAVDDLKWMGGQSDGSWGPQLQLTFGLEHSTFASDDATAFEKHPEWTANELHGSNIFIGEATDSTVNSYVKFYIGNISGQDVESVEFSTRSDMADGQTMVVKLVESGVGFSRDTTYWNNKPSTGAELATVVLDDQSDRKIYTETGSKLTDYVNMKLANGEEMIAFCLQYKSGAGDQFKWMGGAGDGTWGPQMVLNFVQPVENDTLLNIADAYVDEYTPDANYGDPGDMHIHNTDTTDKQVYLKFDLSEVNRDVVVGAAKLNVYIAQHNSGAQVENYYIEVLGSDTVDWEEYGVTWNSKPGATTGVLVEANIQQYNSGVFTLLSSNAFTHYLNDVIMSGADSITFIMRGKDETAGRLWMAGKDWKNGAQLILDYTVEPPAQEFTSIADAYVSEAEGEQDSNFGSEADQHLLNSADGSKWNYFKYSLNDAYKEPVSVELVVYGSIHNSNSLQNFEFEFFGTTNCNWTEDTLTWNNKVNPENDILLTGNLKQGGEWYRLSSPAFTQFVNNAIDAGDTCITMIAKGKNETGDQRAWFSGNEWRASYLVFNYEPEAAQPRFEPAPGSYIDTLNVTLSTLTTGATIYYTLDGTEPSDGSMEYTGPIGLNDTTTIRAIAYAPELNPSTIGSATYNITPVGLPWADPSTAVKYQDTVTIRLMVEPADAIIRYSDDGSAPTTLYENPLFLETTTTIKAQAFSADFTYSTPVVEFTYEVIPTVKGVGTGPGGVGFKDLTLTGNPELSLWLKPDVLYASAGDTIKLWPDASGNGNDAYNTYEEGGNNKIPNTGESQKPAPIFVENGLNGMPIVQFGAQAGEDRSLIVDDADNLDGGAGISIFTVVKRNEMFGGFAAILQKRDISADQSQESYTFEMNGGGDPNMVQLVINKDLFLRNNSIIDTNKFYLLNSGLNNSTGLAYFFVDGELEKTAAYGEVVNSSHAPVIIGGFQAYSFAEVVTFNSELNMAQTTIVQNYLTAKYNLDLRDGVELQRLYNNTDYIYDIIGVGKAKSLDNNSEEEHLNSGGGALQLISTGFDAAGDYVFAGHNGAEIVEDETTKAWGRVWNVEFVGGASEVTIGFDFATAGLSSVPSTDHKLWYKATEADDWTEVDAEGAIESENPAVIRFAVTGASSGLYTIAVSNPVVGIEDYINISDNVNLFPNPAEDQVMVTLNNNQLGKVDISIVDFTGRTIQSVVTSKVGTSFSHVLGIQDLEKGSYFVIVKQNNNRATKMLLKN